MELTTILVHVDLSRHAPSRLRAAANLARTHGGHLLGVAPTGIPRAVFPEGYDAHPGTLSASYYAPLVENARRALSDFEAIASETQVPCTSRLVCDQADDALARMARFADLVVLSQDDPDEAMTDMAVQIPEYVILNSARPVLVMPRTDPAPVAAYKVLLAWDGSKESSFATSSAVPILRRAAAVTVATLTGPGMSEADCRREHDELLGFLGRHQVAPAFLARETTESPGLDILGLARTLGCDLLVMGCYGHAKWRELCLGGASRTVLAESEIPLLLAH
jgi:nucleotide-binding universal stress UspA family protein